MSLMKIAISAEGKNVPACLEESSSFVVVYVADGKVKGMRIIAFPYTALNIPLYLYSINVNCIISRSMGDRADMFFKELSIFKIATNKRRIDDVIKDLEMKNQLGLKATATA